MIVSWNSGELARQLAPAHSGGPPSGGSGRRDRRRRQRVERRLERDSPPRRAPTGSCENPVNAGYVVAASQGIALARGAWIMLANPDLTVSEAFVGTMLDAARDPPPQMSPASCPTSVTRPIPSVVNSRGIEVDDDRYPGGEGRGAEAPTTLAGPSRSSARARAAASSVGRALAEVGGLEPLYFAYLEDVDVGWRLRKKGYRSFVVPGAVALHEGSASTGEGSWLKAFLVARNRRALFRLHGPTGFRPARSGP